MYGNIYFELGVNMNHVVSDSIKLKFEFATVLMLS